MVWSFNEPDSLPKNEFVQWGALLEKRTGVQLAQPQKVLLQTQVSIRMRELGIDKYADYFDYVGDDANGLAEWQVLVDRLVVKETVFFRNRPSLELVRQFIQNRLSMHTRQGSIELWSVGCSTGEEPYGLAAIANDCFLEKDIAPYFGVTAIDVSLPSLSIARTGKYGRRSLSLLSDKERQHYFKPVSDGNYRIKDSIKHRVCFAQYNVLDLKNHSIQPMDIIYCQNVLIYFRRWRRKEILNQLVSHLKPEGILIIGSGEVTDWNHEYMERIANEEVQAYVKYF